MSYFKAKCTKFDFGWDSATNPTVGAYSASPDPLAGFKGPASKGKEGDGRKWQGRRGTGIGVERRRDHIKKVR